MVRKAINTTIDADLIKEIKLLAIEEEIICNILTELDIAKERIKIV